MNDNYNKSGNNSSFSFDSNGKKINAGHSAIKIVISCIVGIALGAGLLLFFTRNSSNHKSQTVSENTVTELETTSIATSNGNANTSFESLGECTFGYGDGSVWFEIKGYRASIESSGQMLLKDSSGKILWQDAIQKNSSSGVSRHIYGEDDMTIIESGDYWILCNNDESDYYVELGSSLNPEIMLTYHSSSHYFYVDHELNDGTWESDYHLEIK